MDVEAYGFIEGNRSDDGFKGMEDRWWKGRAAKGSLGNMEKGMVLDFEQILCSVFHFLQLQSHYRDIEVGERETNGVGLVMAQKMPSK